MDIRGGIVSTLSVLVLLLSACAPEGGGTVATGERLGAPADAPALDVEVVVDELELAWDVARTPEGTVLVTERGGRLLAHDEQGTREYNVALGARRANAVREYLVSKGVPAGRLQTISYGKERPIEVCSEEACYAQNRRAVTVISITSIS